MTQDRFKDQLTGPYLKMNSLDAVTLYVRNIFPQIHVRNLLDEREFYVVHQGQAHIVAHTWKTSGRRVDWHVRVFDTLLLSK